MRKQNKKINKIKYIPQYKHRNKVKKYKNKTKKLNHEKTKT